MENCKKTCGACSQQDECSDKYDGRACAAYAKQGFCTKKKWLLEYCKKSCGVCSQPKTCNKNSDCSNKEFCQTRTSGKNHQKSGVCKEVECDMCSSGKECIVHNHEAVCVKQCSKDSDCLETQYCKRWRRGPYKRLRTCERVKCKADSCPNGSKCIVSNHQTKCINGCQKNTDCLKSQSCKDTSYGLKTCQEVKCTRDNCAQGEHCVVSIHGTVCIKECSKDSDCTKNESCKADINGIRACQKVPCELVTCHNGEECVVSNHEAKCVTRCSQDSDCPKNKVCKVNGALMLDICDFRTDIIKCTKNSDCPDSQYCEEDGRSKTCQRVPCDQVRCLNGAKCVASSHQAICIKECTKDSDCTGTESCKKGSHGKSTCQEVSCNKTDCTNGQKCFVSNHETLCAKECNKNSDCTSDEACEKDLSGFQICQKVNCDAVSCQNGRSCFIYNHKAVCLKKCTKDLDCSISQSCWTISGLRTCRDIKCDRYDCGADERCAVSNHEKFCIKECSKDSDCPTEKSCQNDVYGLKICQKVRCNSVVCPKGGSCVVLNHQPKCVYKCTKDSDCRKNQICEENGTNLKTCRYRTDIIKCTQNSDCTEKQYCEKDGGLKICQKVPHDLIKCLNGYTGIVSNHQAVCIKECTKDSDCLDTQSCRTGVNSLPRCAKNTCQDVRCDKITCPNKESCVVSNHKAVCLKVCTKDTDCCDTQSCQDQGAGLKICQPESCHGVSCGNGAKCVVSNHRATCQVECAKDSDCPKNETCKDHGNGVWTCQCKKNCRPRNVSPLNKNNPY